MTDHKPGPCPACGHADVHTAYSEHQGSTAAWSFCRVETGGCGLQGPTHPTKVEAIDAWNSIRARILREAAEIVERLMDAAEGPSLVGACSSVELRLAADRAKRGE